MHDYSCRCGVILRDQYRTIAEGATAAPPVCPSCGYRMRWIPQIGRMDAGSGSTFQAFETYVPQPDGTQKRTTVSSLHQLRQIERESEQRARDGEGQQMNWRDYSNDRSNADVHSFRPKTPTQEAEEDIARQRAALSDRLGGRISAGRATLLEGDGPALGPGVTESSASVFGSD